MTDEDRPLINPSYVIAQLEKARAKGDTDKAQRWSEALAGILGGTLRPGARVPILDVPVWVTPEVEHGGFVTGRLAAGGPLLPHEEALVEALDLGALGHARMRLNLHFLEEAGRPELEQRLEDGRFRIDVPEEAAALVTLWLLRRGEGARAAALLETLAPYFDRLRFYPAPAERPFRVRMEVSRQSVGDVVASLQAVKTPAPVAAMRASLSVWPALYDRHVALFLETVEGEVPRLARDPDGSLTRAANGQPVVEGGHPLRHFPDDWRARAQALFDDETRARAAHPPGRRQGRARENHARLFHLLGLLLRDPTALGDRERGMLRRVLASFVSKHGRPSDEERAKTRAMQEAQLERPLHAELAIAIAAALAGEDPEQGLPGVDAALDALVAELVPGSAITSLPEALRKKALRCLEAPVERLVELGVLGSAESLALVIPELTAAARARGIADPALRRIWGALYLAFRSRRSLLLVNLERQIQLEELPWMEAVAPWVGSDEASRTASARVLRQVASLSLRAFPQTMVPNRLVRELGALAEGAGLALPLVEELAADIFMGSFSPKFVDAARIAGRLLQGSLYERYYGLDYARILDVTPADPGDAAARQLEAAAFADLCMELAGRAAGPGFGVTANRAVIEQAQLLTTHNLATLVDALLLEDGMDLQATTRSIFWWIGRHLTPEPASVRRAGQAWRQLVFFLSRQGPGHVEAFLDDGQKALGAARGSAQEPLSVALAGLRAVASGASFDADGRHASSGGRRFLVSPGERHWMLGAASPTR